ncbi:MAG: choice-of-anchor Q domain-containing protein [Archaeoglobales archaeon]|nr:choice-of-anchor Q domain-containing protein [Archaeoglobales archaeon]
MKATSPAIDKGAVGAEIDLDYNPRPYGKGYDMGCYEFTPAPKLTPRTMVTTPVKTITSATPAETPKPAIPGFEISLAIIAIVSIACMLVGKRQ